jgi:hypothetical protein
MSTATDSASDGFAENIPVRLNLQSLLRSPYTFLLLVFVVSRIFYHLLGVRFDASGLPWFFQFLDPELLRHHLLQSLFYLHQQPPGYNLFLGIVLKCFPQNYAAAFHAIHLFYGVIITFCLYYLMRRFRAGKRLAFISTSLFMVSPGVVLFENFILYEYQVMVILMSSAALLFQFIQRRSAISAISFLACQFWLVMLRSQYHLVYFAAIFILLLYFVKHHRALVTGTGSVLLVIILSLYLKNHVLFGQFVSSTWLNMNMYVITVLHLNHEEREDFIAQGHDAFKSYIDAKLPLSRYKIGITLPPKTSIPALDQELKPSGWANYNNRGYIEVGKFILKDALFIFKHYPKAYVRSVGYAWLTYFKPSSDFEFFGFNRPHIRKIERLFAVVFFGQLKAAPEWLQIKHLYAQGKGLKLILYTGIFLLLGLPALVIFSLGFLYRGVRHRTLDQPRAIVLGFILFNVAYCTAVANFLSSFENNRYRFPIDGFYLILAVLAIEQVRKRFFRPREG